MARNRWSNDLRRLVRTCKGDTINRMVFRALWALINLIGLITVPVTISAMAQQRTESTILWIAITAIVFLVCIVWFGSGMWMVVWDKIFD